VTNNDLLRRIRYVFDYSDPKMIEIFALGGLEVDRDQLRDWLKKEGDPELKVCNDKELATFLNGLISFRRGKREGGQPEPEKRLNNNIILRKLKIALDLQADEMLDLLALADVHLSKHELSAFFRKPEHKHFRKCKDQVLRNFVYGMTLKYRDDVEQEGDDDEVEVEESVVDEAPKKPSVWDQSTFKNRAD